MSEHDASAGPSGGWVLGVDLGGTACRAVALAPDGTVRARRVRRTPRDLTAAGARQLFLDEIDALEQPSGPRGVGIGASGPIDADGVVRNPDTLPAFTGLPLVEDLAGALGVPVVVENDAVTAAIAEHRTGAARGAAGFLHVTLGTGVGVCAVVGGRPFRGADGTHPEAGHLTIAGPTPPCYCGRASCWEQGASRGALQREAAALTGREADDPGAIGAAQRAAHGGDEAALAVFDAFGARLADGLGTLLGLFRTDLVVLGGSGALAHAQFRAGMDSALRRTTTTPTHRVVVTGLDDFGGAVGAGLLALDALPR